MRAVIVALSLAISSEGTRSIQKGQGTTYVEGHSSNNISDPSTGPSIQVAHGEQVSELDWKYKRDFVVHFGCTGAVSGDMVLTAAHCINGKDWSVKTVSTAHRTGIKVIKTWVHPDGWDVGMMQLESPQNTRSRMRLSAKPLEQGQSVALSGFGKTESGSAGTLHDTGELKIIKCKSSHYYVACAGSGAGSKISTCGGDSGAPWFIHSGSTFYIVGVNFGGGGGGGCGSYTKNSALVRTEKIESWVKSITSKFQWESHGR